MEVIGYEVSGGNFHSSSGSGDDDDGDGDASIHMERRVGRWARMTLITTLYYYHH